MSEILLRKLTRREFRDRMGAGELQACIIPVAAVEQHLEHLAMEHDWRSVTLVAERAAQALAPQVLVAEAVMAGISEHHMKHLGTITLRPGTFITVLEDVIDSMVRAGFQNILVLNGHGGNITPCRAIWEQFVRRNQVNLQFLSYFELLTEADTELLKSGSRIPQDLPGHAQEFETSIALAEFPENVRQQAMSEQADQNPAYATAEQGREFLQRIHDRLVAYLSEMIDGSCVESIPEFHP